MRKFSVDKCQFFTRVRRPRSTKNVTLFRPRTWSCDCSEDLSSCKDCFYEELSRGLCFHWVIQWHVFIASPLLREHMALMRRGECFTLGFSSFKWRRTKFMSRKCSFLKAPSRIRNKKEGAATLIQQLHYIYNQIFKPKKLQQGCYKSISNKQLYIFLNQSTRR